MRLGFSVKKTFENGEKVYSLPSSNFVVHLYFINIDILNERRFINFFF